jgi:hypothetical protein
MTGIRMFQGDYNYKDPEELGGGMITCQCLNLPLTGLTQPKFTAQMEILRFLPIVLGSSSVCTQIWLKKRTIKWPRAGKKMLEEPVYS